MAKILNNFQKLKIELGGNMWNHSNISPYWLKMKTYTKVDNSLYLESWLDDRAVDGQMAIKPSYILKLDMVKCHGASWHSIW